MSATEIIAEIKKLPREEQRKVAIYFGQMEKDISTPASVDGVSEEFKRIANEVFTTNAELFKKLAQ